MYHFAYMLNGNIASTAINTTAAETIFCLAVWIGFHTAFIFAPTVLTKISLVLSR